MAAYIWELARKESYPGTRMPEFALTLEFARWLDRVFPPEGRAEAEESPELKALRKLLDDNKKLPPMKSVPIPSQLAAPATGNQWGKLLLEVAPMERNARTARILSQKVPSDMGTRMRDISRIFSDSKLFERRKKVLGGTTFHYDRLDRITSRILKRESQLSVRPLSLRRFDEELKIIKDIYYNSWSKRLGVCPYDRRGDG